MIASAAAGLAALRGWLRAELGVCFAFRWTQTMTMQATPPVEESMKPQSVPSSPTLSPKLKLLGSVFIILLMVAGLLGIGAAGVEVISGLRAYVGGEGLWSKAQKDATAELLRYAAERDEKHYQEFNRLLEAPLGLKQARLELEKKTPDLKVAHRGFEKGGIHPEDIETMARLFRWFRNAEHIDRAIGIWARGDDLIAELQRSGRALHEQVSSNDPSEAEIRPLVADVLRINRELTVLEQEFSYALGDASRWAAGLFIWTMVCFAAFAAAVCLGLFFFVGKIISSLQASREALARESEALAQKSEELEQQNWLITAQNSLNEKIRGVIEEAQFCNNVISFLVTQLQGVVGIFYVVRDETRLCPVGLHAFDPGKHGPREFQFGEGLVGQAAEQDQRIVVSPAPKHYLKVRSALGETHPRHIMILPIAHEDRVVGVLEIGNLVPFSETAISFLERASGNIAIALKMLHATERRD
jgi:putative methionine-R-sulfoxide reductase with GAF domain